MEAYRHKIRSKLDVNQDQSAPMLSQTGPIRTNLVKRELIEANHQQSGAIYVNCTQSRPIVVNWDPSNHDQQNVFTTISIETGAKE